MDRKRSGLRATRTRLTLWILLPVCAVISAVPALAGDDVWTAWGPPGSGGGTVALAADPGTPDRLYASAPPDLLASADGGASWSWSGIGLGGALIQALAVDPTSTAVVYADSGDALYRSDDAARHWRKIFSKHARSPLLAAAPSRPPALYTADGADLIQSTDAGATWTRIYSAAGGAPLRGLVVDPVEPRRLYLLAGSDLVQSADGGTTWSPTGPVASGAPFAPANRIAALTLAPAAHTTVYAAAGAGFYRSSDAGAHWTQVNELGGEVLAAATAEPGRLYMASTAGASNFFFSSADGGTTWHPVTGLTSTLRFINVGIRALASDPGSATVYAATSINGVVPLSAGVSALPDDALSTFPTDDVGFLKFDPNHPASVYAGTVAPDYQLFHSADSGRSWTRLGEGLNSQPGAQMDLELDPAHPDAFYLALLEVYHVDLNGQRMTATGASLGGSPRHLLRRGNALLAAGCGILRRVDGEIGWHSALACSDGSFGPLRTVRRLIGTAANPALAYALVFHSGTTPEQNLPFVYKSRDGGVTWDLLSRSAGIITLAIDPSHPSTVYAGTLDRVLKSTNGGRSWTPLADLAVNDLLVDTTTPSTLYAATDTRGVLRSLDGGATWRPMNRGLAQRSRVAIASLTADPVVPHQIYANPWHGFLELPSTGGYPGLFVIRFTDAP